MKKWIFTAIIILIIIVIVSFTVFNGLMPSLNIMLESRLTDIAVNSAQAAVDKALKKDYTELLNCEKDNEGNIVYLSVDTLRLNRLALDALKTINDDMRNISYTSFNIKAGDLVSSAYTVGLGWDINVKVLLSGNVTYKFESITQEAGINQTRFALYIIYEIPLAYNCGFAAGEFTVPVSVPAYEAIIVGNVPETFAKLSNAADFMNLMP